jgi:hypothetical protein
MKTVAFSMLLLIVTLYSCKKDVSSPSTDTQTISISSLPLKVSSYISNNFPAEHIISASQVSNGAVSYVVILNTREQLAFDKQGDIVQSGVPDGVMVEMNEYSGNSVNFIPMSVGKYVSANYAGYSIKHIEMDTVCQLGVVYELALQQSKTDFLLLYFSTSGNYVAKAERSVIAELPASIQNYITANYPGYTPRNTMIVITLANGRLLYNVYLYNGKVKSVILNTTADFVCESAV